MNTEFYLRTALLHAAQIATFILVLRVYLKRREVGFLVLAIGLGIQEALPLLGLLYMAGAGDVFQPLLFGKLSSIVIYAPLVLTLTGWGLLAKKKEPNQPSQRNASTGSVSNFQSPARRG